MENLLSSNFISINRDMFYTELSADGIFIARDNADLHELLNDASVYVSEIQGQETWTMSDGSYITRNADEYWVGDDVDTFDK